MQNRKRRRQRWHAADVAATGGLACQKVAMAALKGDGSIVDANVLVLSWPKFGDPGTAMVHSHGFVGT